MNDPIRVINIFLLTPDLAALMYSLPQESFLKTWENDDGKIFGLINDKHFRKYGEAITKNSGEIKYEVWQPSLGADKVYDYSVNNNIHYKLFPAKLRKKLYGYKIIKEISPIGLIEELEKINNSVDNTNTVINLNNFFESYLMDIIKKITRIPIVFTFNTEIRLPSTMFFSLTKNIPSKINWIAEHYLLKKYINRISCITYQNEKNLNHLKRIYKGKTEKLTMGCDFSFWKKQNKIQTRKELRLPEGKFIMLSACYWAKVKQIDKFIKILNTLNSRYDFLYLLAGYSIDNEYGEYIKKLAHKLCLQGKILFLGGLTDNVLLKYYNAADLFVTSSKSEGGPVSVIQAFACELPVFSTKTGNTAELMEEENAGLLVEINEYEEWSRQLGTILETKQSPSVLNRIVAKSHYDWDSVANKFINLYKTVCAKKEGE